MRTVRSAPDAPGARSLDERDIQSLVGGMWHENSLGDQVRCLCICVCRTGPAGNGAGDQALCRLRGAGPGRRRVEGAAVDFVGEGSRPGRTGPGWRARASPVARLPRSIAAAERADAGWIGRVHRSGLGRPAALPVGGIWRARARAIASERAVRLGENVV